ncbi:DNA primase large subunit-like isoform X2 [Daktulosphaira vitifoliae]|uniref:DNA primase large subunit-like isoform X2 n=1 Tax=Daktulosphaira vitifoliae TaxID=58002 RepID=UPI0021AA802A|nr:DNA primase large subunit-like isoform X2 [Daktulosphaira vitifoliae]
MFYLQIPNINMSIFDIEDASLARLQHFVTYSKLSDKPKYGEYLRISSLLDYSGFLSLSLTGDSDLKEVIIEGECNLITERLNLLKPQYMIKYLIHTIKEIECLNTVDENTKLLLKVCKVYKEKQHEPCDENCDLESLKVPWQKCLTLMIEYKVFINNGIATVPCKFWNKLLVDLFRFIYTKSLYQISRNNSSLYERDLRLEYITYRINTYYNSKVKYWKNKVCDVAISEICKNNHLLPPCMLLSLDSLFSNHRLAHDPRYRLTLFLKEIGVPIEQTLELFKQHYSMSHNQGSVCTHSWDEHHKKIIYNIKYTYGQLGTKKNYRMQSCIFIQKQNSVKMSDEGCCPFVNCSNDKLKYLLEKNIKLDSSDLDTINELKNSDQPIRACHWYAQKLKNKSDTLCHNTPVEYYFNLKSSTKCHISL